MRHVALIGTLAVLAFAGFAPAADTAPALEEALAWIKQVDAQLGKPRYPDLTVEQLKTLEDLKLGGHSKAGPHIGIKDPNEVRVLAALPALKKLSFAELDGVTDDALAHVGKLANLTEIGLGDCGITDAGIKHLLPLKTLISLDLGWTKNVTDAALADVLKLQNLEVLGLGGTKISDAGLPQLAQLPKLKELRLAGTGVTDKGIASLHGLKTLAMLKLGKKHKIGPQALAALKQALPGCTVQ